MREVIATGKSVEQATEAGCAQLGCSRDEVSVEILEMPAKKLFRSTPAKVRVTADEPEPQPAPQQPKADPRPKAKPQQGKKQPPPKEEQPAPKAVLSQEKEERIDPAENPMVAAAAEYLGSIFTAMGAGETKITAFKQGDATLLRVEGDGIAQVLETRGETIQALSYLTDRAVNKGVDKRDEKYLRIRLDVSGYRSRREGELIKLAHRTAEEVVRTKRSRTLAPMNPYERLIVHTTISSMDGVMSESIGADTERRVVVKSTAPDATDGDDWQPPRKGGSRGGKGPRRDQSGGRPRDNRGGHSDRNRSDRPRQDRNRGGNRGYGGKPPSSTPEREYADKKHDPDASPVVPKPRDAIKDGDDLPLYGKIEL